MTRGPGRGESDVGRPRDVETRKTCAGIDLGPDGEIEAATLYERCTFRGTSAQARDLAGARFVDCVFRNANLSVAVVKDCSFVNVRFEECKATGVDWSPAVRMSGVAFRRCLLDDCAFVRMDLKHLVMSDCRAVNATFSESDLTEAVLCGTDLSGARFASTKLRNVDLRGTKSCVVDARTNDLRGAKVRLLEASGILFALGLEVE